MKCHNEIIWFVRRKEWNSKLMVFFVIILLLFCKIINVERVLNLYLISDVDLTQDLVQDRLVQEGGGIEKKRKR